MEAFGANKPNRVCFVQNGDDVRLDAGGNLYGLSQDLKAAALKTSCEPMVGDEGVP
jgi:hypothetical protein